MRLIRRSLSAVLSALLVLEAFGPSAWAQVAASVAPASSGASASVAGAGLSSLGGLSAGPALLLHSPSVLSPLSAAGALAPSVLLAPAVSPAVPLAAAAAVPAASRPAAVVALKAKAVRETGPAARVSALVESAAPALEKVLAAASSPSNLKGSGEDLEVVLSEELLLRPAAASEGHSAPAASHVGSALTSAQSFSEGPAAEPGASASLPVIPEHARTGFRLYAAGISVVKVGIEALNLVVPTLLLAQFGAATLVGALFLSSQVAGLVAGWVAGPLVDRFSPSKVLAVTAMLQIAAIGAIPLAFAFGTTLGLPAIFALFTVNGMFGGAFDIARRAALPQILGRDERVLNAHNAKIYITREIAAMAGIFGTGYLLTKLGYLATIGIHPAAYIIAALLFFRLAFRRGATPEASVKNTAAPAEGPKGLFAALKGLTRGARLVWFDPALRRAALLNLPVITLHNIFHQMLAVVYAAKVLGSPAAAAILLGAWNLGEFVAALVLRRQAARQPDASKLGASWLRYASVAVLGSWLLWLFPSVYVAAPVIFFMSMAMLGNELGLASYFQSAASKEDVGAVTGFVYSLATTAGMLALLTMGWIFDGFGGATGFLVLAVALSGASVFFWLSSRRK